RPPRPDPQPVDERVDRGRLALGHDLDAPVGQVACPAGHSEPGGPLLGRPAEPHALHAARDDDALADRVGRYDSSSSSVAGARSASSWARCPRTPAAIVSRMERDCSMAPVALVSWDLIRRTSSMAMLARST